MVLLSFTPNTAYLYALGIGAAVVLGQKLGDVLGMRLGIGGSREKDDKKS